MALLHRLIPSLFFRQVKKNSGYSSLRGPSRFLHNGTGTESDIVVNTICDSFRRGYNWEILNKSFDFVEINHLLVEKVLLELKEPTDAKRALGFFHWSAHRNNFVHEVNSYCVMVNILVRALLTKDAQALLESVLKKSEGYSSKFVVVDSLLSSYKVTISTPLVFNLLVQTYAKMRLFEFGFEVCCYLEQHGFTLSLKSFNILIHVVQRSDRTSLVWKIYEHMIQKRIFPNAVTIKTMIDALCKEGKLQTIVEMLDKIHGKRCSPLVIVNAYLVFRILEEGRTEIGMALLKFFLQKNMILDTIAYSFIVYAKLRHGNLDSAMEIYEEMLRRGFSANSFLYTSFIEAYCDRGKMDEANQLFEEMENLGLKPYVETFNFLIQGCAKAGRVDESLGYCEKMIERRLIPSPVAFNLMVANVCTTEQVKRADAMLTHLLDRGFVPNDMTYSHLIAGYARVDQIRDVIKIYYEMEYRAVRPGLLAFTSLIRSLCHCGKLDQAEKYLRIMKGNSLNPNVEIYDAMITGHFEKGDKIKALQLYNEMIASGLKPCCSYDLGSKS